jgi:hypothetical protein
MSTLRNTASQPLQRRHMARVVTALGIAVTAGLTTLAAACGDGPTGPAAPTNLAPAEAPASSSSSTAPVSVTTLRWLSPVKQTMASAVIGPAGGALTAPGGATLVVPRGAVTANTMFTITRLPGRIVAYDFQPHGRSFGVPLTVRQPAAGTTLGALDSVTGVEGAYFASLASLDEAAGLAKVDEFTPSTTVAADRSWVAFTVTHFSGYLMSTGRQ